MNVRLALRGAVMLCAAACGSFVPSPAAAQGLLWQIPPEDGTWVRYYGNYKNIQERPDSNEGPLELTWLSELTIKSVGKETVEIGGQPTACRWIEFKLVTGYQSATGIDPGPYGTRIYKVLVPESKVVGAPRDPDLIPIEFIPIVKGYRKIGDKPAVPVKEKVLTVYPMLSMFAAYKNLAAEASQAETLDLPQYGAVQAFHLKGQETLETNVSRSVSDGEIWLSPEVPFGWAKYTVKLVREEKDSTATKEDFKKAAQIEVDMSAVEKGTGAQSDIGDVPE